MNISFAKDGNWKEQLLQCYTFRMSETPDFTQREKCIAGIANPTHKEGFDNISLISKEKYGVGVTATLHCSFVGDGCPEIILVEQPRTDPDGAVRYDHCFEVVLWQNGINVWRYHPVDGKCVCHQRLGLTYSVPQNTVHELTVTVKEDQLLINLNGQKTLLRTEDLPEKFYIGVTACEGEVELYDFTVRE
ncbi:MAG: hypothetical protein E7454_00940 [Ruminococcaceae bacterium]|nr:hypothetical protein [Oscillospiraceae bacterium]